MRQERSQVRITGITGAPTLDSWTYAYNPLDRLTGATNNPGPSETTVAYATDAASNRVTNTGLGGGGAMTYPTQGPGSIRPHTPTAIVGAGATYDLNGAMLTGLGRTLSLAMAAAAPR